MADEKAEEKADETPKKRAAPAGAAKKRASSSSRARGETRRTRPNAVKVAREAREQLEELLDRTSEGVIGVRRTDDGWEVDLEVVETRRVPDTTDVLAIYRVQLDTSGSLEGYQRLERYIRGQAEGGVTDG